MLNGNNFVDIGKEHVDATCGISTEYHEGLEIPSKDSNTTEEGRWPWAVSLYMNNDTVSMCHGALLDNKHIVTAANCVSR